MSGGNYFFMNDIPNNLNIILKILLVVKLKNIDEINTKVSEVIL